MPSWSSAPPTSSVLTPINVVWKIPSVLDLPFSALIADLYAKRTAVLHASKPLTHPDMSYIIDACSSVALRGCLKAGAHVGRRRGVCSSTARRCADDDRRRRLCCLPQPR